MLEKREETKGRSRRIAPGIHFRVRMLDCPKMLRPRFIGVGALRDE